MRRYATIVLAVAMMAAVAAFVPLQGNAAPESVGGKARPVERGDGGKAPYASQVNRSAFKPNERYRVSHRAIVFARIDVQKTGDHGEIRGIYYAHTGELNVGSASVHHSHTGSVRIPTNSLSLGVPAGGEFEIKLKSANIPPENVAIMIYWY